MISKVTSSSLFLVPTAVKKNIIKSAINAREADHSLISSWLLLSVSYPMHAHTSYTDDNSINYPQEQIKQQSSCQNITLLILVEWNKTYLHCARRCWIITFSMIFFCFRIRCVMYMEGSFLDFSWSITRAIVHKSCRGHVLTNGEM